MTGEHKRLLTLKILASPLLILLIFALDAGGTTLSAPLRLMGPLSVPGSANFDNSYANGGLHRDVTPTSSPVLPVTTKPSPSKIVVSPPVYTGPPQVPGGKLIIAPKDGFEAQSNNIWVQLDLTNIILTNPKSTNVEGQGHVNFFLDFDPATVTSGPVVLPSPVPAGARIYKGGVGIAQNLGYYWKSIPNGNHTIAAEVVQNDDTPFTPRINMAVNVNVQGPFPNGTPIPVPTVIVNAPARVPGNRNFTVKIDITGVTALDAASYEIGFDPAVLSLTDVLPGSINGTAIPVDIWNEVSNGRYIIVQNVPGFSGVNGTGTLANLRFFSRGQMGNSSYITISSGTLSDINAQGIYAVYRFNDFVSISVIPGDANRDGAVNAIDITKVERMIAMLDAAEDDADANWDGNINAIDITKVERIIAGLP